MFSSFLSRQRVRKSIRYLTVMSAGACLAGTVVAAQSPAPEHVAAGTAIQNTAVVSYAVSGVTFNQSAQVTFLVDQILDVTATWQNTAPVQAPAGASDKSLLFKITNLGNGNDSYALSLEVTPDPGNGFTAKDCGLYLDSDHNDVWSDQDAPYPRPTPTLAAGEAMDILVVCTIPDDAPDQSLSQVELTAASNTLSGPPGTSEPDPDNNALVLVVGLSGNTASATGTYLATNVTFALTSTALVTDVSGGHVATSGSTITYTITATPHGAATGRDLILTTPIPTHTTYVPGSLELNGTPLGDSNSDGDAGYFDPDANATVVLLGDVSGNNAPDHIRFQVTIN